MKSVDLADIDKLPGIRLEEKDRFRFRCHGELACFNQCCRNLNLFLHPYDVMRLRKRLGISSGEFSDKFTDVVMRPGNHFPEVLLKMTENEIKSCPFMTVQGCSVYSDRPDTCRTYPVERGVLYDASGMKSKYLYFFKPPEFCLGKFENTEWTPETWTNDQESEDYLRMTAEWAEIRALFRNDPWNGQGIGCPKGKMTFMAAYDIDRFREFVFHSSFPKRYEIKKDILAKLKRNDTELLRLGFEWIRFYLWGIKPEYFEVV